MALMTAAQFIEYAHEALSDEALEGLCDCIAEHNGEIAMFGDAGPGSGYRLHQQIDMVHRIEARLAKLERREPRPFRFNVRHPR